MYIKHTSVVQCAYRAPMGASTYDIQIVSLFYIHGMIYQIPVNEKKNLIERIWGDFFPCLHLFTFDV